MVENERGGGGGGERGGSGGRVAVKHKCNIDFFLTHEHLKFVYKLDINNHYSIK